MARQPTLALALIALMVIATAGCGGDDGDSPAADGASAKDAYLERANAACEEARAGLQREVTAFLERREGTKPQPELYADVTRLVVLPSIESEMEAVRAIRAPGVEGKHVDRLLYAEQLTLDQLVFEDRQPSLEAVERRFAPAAKRLRDYGLTDCANRPKLSG